MMRDVQNDRDKLTYLIGLIGSIRDELDHTLSVLFDQGYSTGFTAKENAIVSIILLKICIYFKISTIQLKSDVRDQPLPMARHIYCVIARKLLRKDVSLARIGSVINKDHATVIHGIKKVVESKESKGDLYYDYLEIFEQVMLQVRRQYTYLKILSDISKKDLQDCPDCKATGYDNNHNFCSHCDGSGSILISSKQKEEDPDEFKEFIDNLEIE